MDNHPIPQDVTGFQFKLIGSMTVKQFGFIAAGVIPAVIVYYIPNPGSFFLITIMKIIHVPLFGGTGVAMAFLPIEGRPMDIMIANFFKAIFSPNQYLFHKQGRQLAVAHVQVRAQSKKPNSPTVSQQVLKQQKLASLLQSTHAHTQNSLDERENAYLATLMNATPQGTPSLVTQPTISSPVAHVSPLPVTSSPISAQPEPVTSSTHSIPMPKTAPEPHETPPISPLPAGESIGSQTPTPLASPPPLQAEEQKPQLDKDHPDVLKEQLAEIARQKAELEKELEKLRSQVQTPQPVAASLPTQPITTPTASQQVSSEQPLPAPSMSPVAKTEEQVTPQPTQQPTSAVSTKQTVVGSAPGVPNLLTGIIKDPRGNVLPNILVDLADNTGNSVRAFKTNQKGEFGTSTPLKPGVYTLTFEDPKKQHRFETIEITVNDTVIQQMMIVSRDDREDLRRALFA